MAIIYQNPLRSVGNPERLEVWVEKARDTAVPYQARQDAIGKLRGAATFYRHHPKHRAAVVWLKQQIVICNARLHDSMEGQDV